MPLEGAVIATVESRQVLSCLWPNDKKRDIVLQILLPKIKRFDTKMSYEYPPEKVDFHYIVENRIIYLVMNGRDGESDGGPRIPFTFLESIKKRFKKEFAGAEDKYCDIETLSEAKCRKFDKVLTHEMEMCNDKDKIKLIQVEIEEVKGVMMKNLESVLNRGEKIDELIAVTDDMVTEAHRFKSNATTLRKKMWWREKRIILLIVVLVLVIIGILVAIICATNDC